MLFLSKRTTQAVRHQLEEVLDEHPIDQDSPQPPAVQQSLHIARVLQERACELQTPAERRQQVEFDRMMQSPSDKATLMQLTDQTFRSDTWARSTDQMIHILDVQGVPRFFSPLDRTMLRGFQTFGNYLPGVAMPFVKEKMRRETANVVLPAEEEVLRNHLTARRNEGLRMNINHLGEALLGQREAEQRMDGYLQMLSRPEIEVVSVKISTLYSQINPVARQYTVNELADRLERLYRESRHHEFERPDGTRVPKFVYLDMEEYRDLRLTTQAFIAALDRPGLENVHAGIVLQAYVPDSFQVQCEINAWARDRVERGGGPLTMRIVKGANMEMERVEASLHGWPQAPYQQKIQTDANYLRMLDEGFKPENLNAVRLGIASHNLFTLAYGLVAAAEARALDLVQFEMLEGMANHQRRALFELSKNLLLYAPVCEREEFVNAIGYLVRRLDENTGPDNFLRHAFKIEVGSEDWQRLEEQFVDSFQAKEGLSSEPRRQQDRRHGIPAIPADAEQESLDFHNEADTDWALPQHGEWAESILEAQRDRLASGPVEVSPVIAGEALEPDSTKESFDPSRPEEVVARYGEATIEDIDRAVACAAADPSGWRSLPVSERREALRRVADDMVSRRGELLGLMLAEGGKLLTESDPEISEAIDFCRFYGDTAQDFATLPGFMGEGRGVVAVVSPWNFPFAIPCGGVAAALAAGNTVILKPASDTVAIAAAMCEGFWRAGVPREALQFAPCPGSSAGQHLVTHPAVETVILTGGTETAQRMLASKPSMRLLAETGGKNATIVTAMADHDLAIKNVLHSAFGHAGQKCSATSLLILEKEIYHDEDFREKLADAIESLHVGSAWDLSTKLAPLVRPPSGDLERGLTTLEPGESWLLEPRLAVDGNPNLVAPGVKWDVAPGSYTHGTEFFGPLLGVMSARNLEEAIQIVNATGYGLTSGLESLDDREHITWREGIRAGNLYINRPTTGAIVLRQPFGGIGKSCVGPGLKAGGPNYVAQLMQSPTTSPADGSANSTAAAPTGDAQGKIQHPLIADLIMEAAIGSRFGLNEEDLARLTAATLSYEQAAATEFQVVHDHFKLLGEDNHRRYLPVNPLWIRVTATDTPWQVVARMIAARVAECHTIVSTPPDLPKPLAEAIRALDDGTEPWGAQVEFYEQTDEQLADVIRDHHAPRIRYAGPDTVPDAIRSAAADVLACVIEEPVTAVGRVELLWYFEEQSISHAYHRYGNLGERNQEKRHEPA